MHLPTRSLPLVLLLMLMAGFSLGAHAAAGSPPEASQILPTPTFPLDVAPPGNPAVKPPGNVPAPDIPAAPGIPTPTFPMNFADEPQRAAPPDTTESEGVPALPTINPPDIPDVPAAPPAIEPQPAARPKDPPRFLSLPFPEDPKIHLLQGWYYDSKGLHQGVDFFRIEEGWTFTGFPVLAAADGYACADGVYEEEPLPPVATAAPDATPTPQHQHRPIPKPEDWWEDDPKMLDPWEDDPRHRAAPPESDDTAPVTPAPRENDGAWGYCVAGFGKRVLIRHEAEGQNYYTYYGHLDSVAEEIPAGSRGTTVWVERGQVIGYAGNTGTGGGVPHLHFGLATPGFGWLDPYDLWTTHEVYPDTGGTNGMHAGPNHFWTTNPPSHRALPKQLPEGYIIRPTHEAVVVGTVDIRGWSRVPLGDVSTVEIWVDGELRGTADYGMWHDDPRGSYGFLWEWDTTRERNGEHTIEVRAISSENESAFMLSGGNVHEESFPVIVQNPEGALDQPSFDSVVDGIVDIKGWAYVNGSAIDRVEIWIDGRLHGIADYGLPHEGAQGDYGFAWRWDTRDEEEGLHTLRVRIIAVNGGSKFLGFGGDLNESYLPLTVRQGTSRAPHTATLAPEGEVAPATWSFAVSKWTVR